MAQQPLHRDFTCAVGYIGYCTVPSLIDLHSAGVAIGVVLITFCGAVVLVNFCTNGDNMDLGKYHLLIINN